MALPETPLTRGEQYLAKSAGQDVALPDVPLTRVEQYLAKIAGEDVAVPDAPLTRLEQYLAHIAENGGGSSVTVEPLTVTSNGTQTAPSGKAYSPVTVNVPNSYANSDIGKVVSSVRTLQYQSSAECAYNGEYNTTYNNRITVNVQPKRVYTANDALLSNPFSELDFSVLYSNLHSGIYSGFLWFEFNSMMVQVELYARNNIIGGMAFKTDPAVVGVECEWGANGVVTLNALMNGQVQDMLSYAPMIPCAFYIYGTTDPPRAD